MVLGGGGLFLMSEVPLYELPSSRRMSDSRVAVDKIGTYKTVKA